MAHVTDPYSDDSLPFDGGLQAGVHEYLRRLLIPLVVMWTSLLVTLSTFIIGAILTLTLLAALVVSIAYLLRSSGYRWATGSPWKSSRD